MSWLVPLEEAWHIFGVGIGQAQIIGFGIVVGVVGTVTYRLLTRGKRYSHD